MRLHDEFNLTTWRYHNDAEFHAAVYTFALETGHDLDEILEQLEEHRHVPYTSGYDLYERIYERRPGAFMRALNAEMESYKAGIIEQLNQSSPLFDIIAAENVRLRAEMTRRRKVRVWFRRHWHPITALFHALGYEKMDDPPPWRWHYNTIRISKQARDTIANG